MAYFIEKIIINKVRHLENVTIELSENEKKHLILTGKNGSGKTTVLEGIKSYLKCIEENRYNSLNVDLPANMQYSERRINELTNTENMENRVQSEIEQLKQSYSYYSNEINRYGNGLKAQLNDYSNLYEKYKNGEFILAYFGAKRNSAIEIPRVVSTVELNEAYGIESNIGSMFLNYLVYLKTQQSFARNENDTKVVEEIGKWFETFEKALKELFEDNSIKLIFDYKNLNFRIHQHNREDYGFDKLSHGYSAVLDIFMNLVLRMEKNKKLGYDIEGIVIIDEIETHLHIELQKKILPFLTTFFGNIQFIISTHSPFVLNSIDNAVIYDLEKKIKVEDLSSYAYDGIVEGFFEIDKYSVEIKEKISRYEYLVFKENKLEDEKKEEQSLRTYLRNVPETLAEELVYKFKSIELKRKTLEIQSKNQL